LSNAFIWRTTAQLSASQTRILSRIEGKNTYG
jgi:hypothetical protein